MSVVDSSCGAEDSIVDTEEVENGGATDLERVWSSAGMVRTRAFDRNEADDMCEAVVDMF